MTRSGGPAGRRWRRSATATILNLHEGAKILIEMSLEDRSRRRRKTMETHRARSHADAETWDLEYWQRRSPEERLSALVAIRRDVELAVAARHEAGASGG